MAKKASPKLTKTDFAAIHAGLKQAGLGAYKIASIHLIPKMKSAGAAAVNDDGPCHAQQLPNGHVVIVC